METLTQNIQAIPLNHYILLCSIIFAIGVTGVLIRRNAIVIFMSVELMLNSVNLLLTAFSGISRRCHRPGFRVLYYGAGRCRSCRRISNNSNDLPQYKFDRYKCIEQVEMVKMISEVGFSISDFINL